jgi:hypothetical protein
MDQTSPKSENAPEGPPPTAPKLFDWLTKNFAFASSVILILSTAGSLIFIVSYFTVFDFNLVWILEYSDLTKLFLISLSLSIASISLFISTFSTITQQTSPKFRRPFILGLISLFAVGAIVDAYVNHYPTSHFFSIAFPLVPLWLIIEQKVRPKKSDLSRLAIVQLFLLGNNLGLHIRNER